MKLSVLDLVPTRSGQSTADALAASASLAVTADSLGFERYWVAEHHNMAAVASTVPAVIIPFLAAGTRRIRFGSGGVMLPNHSALAVAEQFALLESMFPGRIDLGIGRAPGTDQVTAFLLRGAGAAAAPDDFPQEVDLIARLLGLDGRPGDGVDIDLRGQAFPLRATPHLAGAPELWLLGSSDYSAELGRDAGPALRLRPPLRITRRRRGAASIPLGVHPDRLRHAATNPPAGQRHRRSRPRSGDATGPTTAGADDRAAHPGRRRTSAQHRRGRAVRVDRPASGGRRPDESQLDRRHPRGGRRSAASAGRALGRLRS